MVCVDGYCPQVVSVGDSLLSHMKDGTCDEIGLGAEYYEKYFEIA